MQNHEEKPNSRISERDWQKYSILLLHAGFLVAIVLAAWFHYLRSTFGESAVQFFDHVNHPELWTSSTWLSFNWFQNVLTVLAVKCNLPLSLVSVVFSAAPMIFAYLVFGLTHYGLKQKFSGIFLLLLLLGINFSYFDAVNTVFTGLCSIYAFVAFGDFITAKYLGKLKSFHRTFWSVGLFGILAILLLVFIEFSPMDYSRMSWSKLFLSRGKYLLSDALDTYVITGFLALFLCLVWVVKKNFKTLGLFLVWSVILLIFANLRIRTALFTLDYEKLLLPLVALVLFVFVKLIREQSLASKSKFFGLFGLIFLAIGGQLRNLPIFEQRQQNVIKLLHASNAIPAEKIALSENLQGIEKYIDPTFLAYETPLISSFHNLPLKSIFFIPENMEVPENNGFQISENAQNSHYFRFSDLHYITLDTALIPRKLHTNFILNTDSVKSWGVKTYYFPPEDTTYAFVDVPTQSREVFSGKTSVFTGQNVQFALNVMLWDLQIGDSVEISVWRKGSENGLLIVSDDFNPSKIWFAQQTTSESDERGWQKLSTTFIMNQDEFGLKTYVYNPNYKKEIIYFDDFRVRVWRE